MKRGWSWVMAAFSFQGCVGTVGRYTPVATYPGELTLRQGQTLELWAGGQRAFEGPRYKGLAAFVRCVPQAHVQAAAAEASGGSASTLSGVGVGAAILGLGGLTGLAQGNSDVKAGLLLGGVALEVVGLVIAGTARGKKLSAHAHAVDAMNYYNDAVGSHGGTCDAPATAPAKPESLPQAPPPEPARDMPEPQSP